MCKETNAFRIIIFQIFRKDQIPLGISFYLGGGGKAPIPDMLSCAEGLVVCV